jgi:glycosyltransferase involved in cell wall biosynthesis
MPKPDQTQTPALVSIIIRSMDRTTLGETLASVALQTCDGIEVILVNAKGGMHSSVTNHFHRFPVRFVNQGGASLTRPEAANAGLDGATGQYLAFLDDDDALDPDHVSGLLTAVQAEGGEAVVYAGVRCIERGDAAKKITRIFGAPLQSTAQLLAGNFIPIHAPLFPSHLRQHARYDETLATYEDWDFWLQLAQRTRFVYTHKVTATYFTGGTSGVSPQKPDMEAVRLATRVLFAKWMQRTPDEFRNICNLYHETSAELQKSREEMISLVRDIAEFRMQHAVLEQQLNAIRSSRSWTWTQPLRRLSTGLGRLITRYRQGNAVT